ncbi:MAG: hypothetical protein ACOYBC_05520 [Bilifractor sp.]|jgi:hypothetical protein
MKNLINLQLFAVPENETVTTDVEPAVSIDFANRLRTNIQSLQTVLGVTNMIPMSAGSVIKLYKLAVTNSPAQVAEGEDIALTKVQRVKAGEIELTLNKYRRQTTAEAIQKTGQQIAVNETDNKLISVVRGDIKKAFYDALAQGTGTAEGATLQAGLAKGWGAVKKFFTDYDATPIFFVSTEDVAEYLATAQITLQTAFGFDYVENFLGLGTAIVSPDIAAGTAYATAKENLNGAYIPANGGDVANAFSLTSDETGLVGITHQPNTNNASVDTLILSGVKFFPEMTDGVIKINTAKTA